MKTPWNAHLAKTLVAAAVALLIVTGCDSSTPQADAESDAPDADVTDVAGDSGPDQADAPDGETVGAGAIVGRIDDVELTPTYVGVGNLWTMTSTGWLRYGENVGLADLPSLCEVMGSGSDPTDLYALLFWFYDTEPGTYVVQESPDEETVIGTPVVRAYLTGRRLDENLHKRFAISGEVVLTSISPSTNEPLTEESVAEGTFTLVFLLNANATIECMTICDASGCTTTCDCEHPDGSGFSCDAVDPEHSCCNDGITETQTVTGWFRASYCLHQCVCLGMDPGCPCFD
jgi:hypothetical protein